MRDERFMEAAGPDLPLVSLIVPCYNEEKYIAHFLASVLAQNYPKIELILIDDGSTDRTPEIVQSYESLFTARGFRFQMIRSSENRGAAAAINIGLRKFNGEYLMWADSDDILYSGNVEEKVRFLEQNLDCGFVLSQMESVDEDALDSPESLLKRSVSGDRDPMIEDLLLSRNVVYGPGCILVRRKVFEKAFPSQTIYESRQGQNYQLLFPLAYCSKCGYLDEVLAKYVIHEDSHSRQKRTFAEKVTRIREFINIAKETLSRIPGMSQKDYCRYMRIAEQEMLENELRLSLQYLRWLHYREVRGEMKRKGLIIHRSVKPFFFYGRIVKRFLFR